MEFAENTDLIQAQPLSLPGQDIDLSYIGLSESSRISRIIGASVERYQDGLTPPLLSQTASEISSEDLFLSTFKGTSSEIQLEVAAAFDSLIGKTDNEPWSGIEHDWLTENSPSRQTDASSIVFVDSSVINYQSLIAGVKASEVIFLNSMDDGIQQITEVLAQRSKVSNIHVISHGQAANLHLGAAELSENTVNAYASALQSWSRALTPDADILFYGCNVAAGEMGAALVQKLSQLTGADIGASDDRTGSAALGGDWELEVTQGMIESPLAFKSQTIEAYQGIFNPTINFSNFSSIAGLKLNGNAAQASNVLRLTPALKYQAGSTFFTTPFTINSNTSFQTRFQFRLHGGKRSGGADGLTFMLQNSATGANALGENGGSLGYGDASPSVGTPITNSLGIEFDTYKSSWDSNNNHVALLRNGNVTTALAQGNPSIDLNNGSLRNAWIDYDGGTNVLKVFLSGTTTKPITPLFTHEVDLLTEVGANAFVGFSAGTGGLSNNQDIANWQFTTAIPPTSDTTAPTVSQLVANNITAGEGSTYTFNVTYRDNVAVNIASLDNSDVRVTGPGGFSQLATRVSVSSSSNGSPRTATYRINAPGGSWDTSEIGTYAINLQANQVSDTSNNFVSAATLGSFQVLADAIAPTANLSAANISTGGESLYNFTVTYNDNIAIKTATLDGSDVRVTGPNGYSQLATLASVDSSSNGSPRTATYQINAPGGTWNGTDNGNYTVQLLANTVSDVNNNFVAASALGSFEVNLPFNAGKIALSPDPVIIRESNGTATITVVRTDGSDGSASIDYNTPGNSATPGADYTSTSGTLTFNEGETSKQITVPILSDGLSEGIETFNVSLNNVGGATLGTKRTVLVTVVDNDNPQRTLAFYEPAIAVNEGDGTVPLTVILNGQPSTGTVMVDYATGNNTATAGSDYTATSGKLNFAPGEIFKPITIPILDNISSSPEPNKSFSITLSNPVGANIDVQNPATITIADDDTFVRQVLISDLAAPTAFDWTPDGSRMYIAQKDGVVRVFENGTLSSTPFVDISQQVNNVRDRGLLGLAVHPDFPNQPYIYLLFTYDPPEVYDSTNVSNPNTLAGPDESGNRPSRLIRVTADASTNYTTAIAGSEVVLLGKNSTWANTSRPDLDSTGDNSIPASGITADGTSIADYLATDSQSHSIGMVKFGVDGSLFVGNGDGTSYGRVDPRTVRVQSLDNLSGKILRINPLTGEGYADNPFYDGNPNSNRSKVYSYGLRNPFRFTINRSNNEPVIGDVGWNAWEEINTGRGKNFGWPYYEGGLDSSGNPISIRQSGYSSLSAAQEFYISGQTVTAPIFARQHTSGVSAIVMGDFYAGTTFPDLYRGALFFTDVNGGTVDAAIFDASGKVSSVQRFAAGLAGIVQITTGLDSNLYYVNLGRGEIGRWRYNDLV